MVLCFVLWIYLRNFSSSCMSCGWKLNQLTLDFSLLQENIIWLIRVTAITKDLLLHIPRVRYHLHECRGANQLARNAKELFNHCHSSLRNVIQRSFDLLKA